MFKMKFTFYLEPIFFKPASYWNKIVEKHKTNFEKKKKHLKTAMKVQILSRKTL